mmetsp:Transcript_26295/g.56712  ORF Transcript_26295/g.56712 Transcript_26295/m.56712 type:complete len:492 (-) Transcript_26295:130-1605(-)
MALFRCLSRMNSSALSMARSAWIRMGVMGPPAPARAMGVSASGIMGGAARGSDGGWPFAAARGVTGSSLPGTEGGWNRDDGGSETEFGPGRSVPAVVETEPTPTRLPRFFFTTFFDAPTGGADHDTPDPAGRPGLEVENRSAGAFTDGADVDVDVVTVSSLAPSEINEVGWSIIAGLVAASEGGGAGAAVEVCATEDRKENPLEPPAPEPALALTGGATICCFSCTATRFVASPVPFAVSSLPVMLPMKLNDDPAVEVVDATSPLLDNSVASAVGAGTGADGAERKENPLSTEGAVGSEEDSETAMGGCGAAGDAADRKENPLPEGAATAAGSDAVAAVSFAEDAVVNPANMDGCAVVVSGATAGVVFVCGGAAVSSSRPPTLLLAIALPAPDMNPNADPAMPPNDDDDESGTCDCGSDLSAESSLEVAVDAAPEGKAAAGAGVGDAPMDDCRNENPLLAGAGVAAAAAGAGADSSLASPFIERPPNILLF